MGIGLGGGFSIKLLGIAHFEGRGCWAAQNCFAPFMKRKSMPHNLYIASKGRARETNSKDQADTRHILLYPIDNPISALKNWKNLKNLKN